MNGNGKAILAMLREPIAWPDTYLGRDPDRSYAKEMFGSLVEMARSAKEPREAKDKDDEKEKKG